MALPASAYANLALVQPPAPPKPGVRARLAEAAAQREAEAFLKRKIDQAARVLDRNDAEVAGLAREIKRLQKRKAFKDARGARIEERILTDMQRAKVDKVTGLRVTFTAKPNPASLVVDHESKVPTEYQRDRTGWDPDKLGMKAALVQRAGESDADHDARVAPILACAHLEQTVSLSRK